MTGWIKLHRSLLDWEWYDDPNTVRVLIHLLITVNHEPSRYRGHDIPAGSRVAGRITLAQEIGLSEKSLRTALEHLKQAGEVAIKSVSKFSIITMVKWDKLQANGPADGPAPGQQAASKWPHLKNERREEGKKNTPLPPWMPADDWKDFLEFRRRAGPLTARAQGLLIRSLEKLRDEGQDPAQVLQQSIMRGWKTLYAVKENANGNTRNDQKQRIADDTAELLERIRSGTARAGTGDHSERPEGLRETVLSP